MTGPRPAGVIAAGHGKWTRSPHDPGERAALDSTSFEALLERSSPAYIAAQNGHLLYVNPAFARLAGVLYGAHSATQLLSHTPGPLLALFERLRDTDGDLVRQDKVMVEGVAQTYFSRHFALDSAPLMSSSATHFAGIYTNIDDKLKVARTAADLRARFNDFIRSSSDWTWETDADMMLTDLSERAPQTFGAAVPQLIGHPLKELGHFADYPPDLKIGDEMIAARVPFRNLVFVVTHDKGGPRQIRLSGVPCFDEQTGSFAGYRGTATDLTKDTDPAASAAREFPAEALSELTLRNRQLDQALSEARQTANAKNEFLAMMSHELRTPLNAIIGLSEMSTTKMHGPLDEPYLGYFHDIRNAGQHLLTIINEMLEATRIDSQQVSLEIEPIRVAKLVEEARLLVAHQARERNIKIDTSSVTGDDQILADAVRARQILVNLLGNALKFTAPGGHVGVEVRRADERLLDIIVWDTGIGISPDKQRLVFESFYRIGNNILHTGGEGIGLGLSISHGLAKQMDGDLLMESETDKGTRVSLRLPIADLPIQDWPPAGRRPI